MKKLFNIIAVSLYLATLLPLIANASDTIVKIHYLGHASFLLQFDNGTSVITDYGTSNSYGLASPIYSFGSFKPDIVTYSHKHTDHYNANYLKDCKQILTNMDSIELNGIKISPIRVSESMPEKPDNSAYLFRYKGYKILHIADIQSYISTIYYSTTVDIIKSKFTDKYDLVFLTLEGTLNLNAKAVKFISYLSAKRLIPMHYWSAGTKVSFLELIEAENKKTNTGRYFIIEDSEADYTMTDEIINDTTIKVIDMTPAVFNAPTKAQTDIIKDEFIVSSCLKHSLSINYYVKQETKLKLCICDLSGKIVFKTDENCQLPGQYSKIVNTDTFQNGIYICSLVTNNQVFTKKILLMR